MVRIRLRRTGKKKQPSYRVVVADSESPRDGRFIENIGIYNPRNDPPTIEIQEDRARYWLSVGAQPSDPVVRLLRKVGILSGDEAAKAVDESEEKAEADAEAEAAEGAEDTEDTEVETAAEAE
jgi:small subunit ribosomal protein S16